MPELPEVETTINELKSIVLNKNINKIILNTDSLRKPINKKKIKKIEGLIIINVSIRGKYIIISFTNDYILLIHLGMSGRLIFRKDKLVINKHDHIVFFIKKNFYIILNDPRKFGLVDVFLKKDLKNCNHLKSLGVEPLTKEFSFFYLKNALLKRKSNIKTFLLNQKIIAGLGNIYVCESLFESNISPFQIAKNLKRKQISLLCLKIKKVLQYAINLKGSSISDFKLPSGLLGKFQNKFKVYDREGKICKRKGCKEMIIRSVINGRSTYYCKKCQKM